MDFLSAITFWGPDVVLLVESYFYDMCRYPCLGSGKRRQQWSYEVVRNSIKKRKKEKEKENSHFILFVHLAFLFFLEISTRQ